VKVLSVDPEAQRMSLSLRQARRAKEKENKKQNRPAVKEKGNESAGHENQEEESTGIGKIGDLVGDVLNKNIFDNNGEN